MIELSLQFFVFWLYTYIILYIYVDAITVFEL